ncbi:MAG: hypothetical protein IT464_13670 [Planctomycetes bacterium]|nr:hypothetical protein [Planctomycetota bacterium]
MRLTLAILLACVTGALVRADEVAPAKHELREAWQKDFVYTIDETETVDSTTVFHVAQKDGGKQRVAGGVTDKHERVLDCTPVAFDDSGATKLHFTVLKHTLLRHELPPGEAAARQTHNGHGPFTGAEWDEEWKTDHWKRALTKAATSQFGQFPEELMKAMRARRYTRQHFMLPADAVAEGATWKPDAKHLLEQFKQFQRQPDAPELEIECKLESVKDGRAVITLKWKAEKLLPVKGDTGSDWKEGTTVTIAGTATLTLHLADQLVEKFESETTAELEGELWNSGAWLPTEATLKCSRVVATTRKKVEPK